MITYLVCKYSGKSKNVNVCLFDKITTAERGMKDIERYLTPMDTVQGVGGEGTFLKVPFRYEIKTALYALMVVSGQYTAEEIKSQNAIDFEDMGLQIDSDYMDELITVICVLKRFPSRKRFFFLHQTTRRNKLVLIYLTNVKRIAIIRLKNLTNVK